MHEFASRYPKNADAARSSAEADAKTFVNRHTNTLGEDLRALIIKREGQMASDVWRKRANGDCNSSQSTSTGITVFMTPEGASNFRPAASRIHPLHDGQVMEKAEGDLTAVRYPDGCYKLGDEGLVFTPAADESWPSSICDTNSFIVGYQSGVVRVETHDGKLWQNYFCTWYGETK